MMNSDIKDTVKLVLTMAALCVLLIILGAIEARRHHTDVAQPTMVRLQVDTLWVHDTLHVHHPAVVREVTRPVPAEVDTAAILAAYYTQRIYADTIRLRDAATVYLSDTLEHNMLCGRGVRYDLMQLEPTIIYDPPPAGEASLNKRHSSSARLALTAGVQLGREQAAVAAGLRIRRAEILGAYDLRLHAPSITLKYDIIEWQ